VKSGQKERKKKSQMVSLLKRRCSRKYIIKNHTEGRSYAMHTNSPSFSASLSSYFTVHPFVVARDRISSSGSIRPANSWLIDTV